MFYMSPTRFSSAIVIVQYHYKKYRPSRFTRNIHRHSNSNNIRTLIKNRQIPFTDKLSHGPKAVCVRAAVCPSKCREFDSRPSRIVLAQAPL